MKLTSTKAKEMLGNARGKTEHDGWINHSICVGNTAYRIAKALLEKGYDIDPNKAKTLGYIHDIGKMVGPFHHHILKGYKYLKDCGYDEEYCNISLTHSYLNNDVNCTAGGFPTKNKFRENFIKNHHYTIYEKIINLCDLMCTNKVVTLEKRLIDIIVRRGVYQNAQYHIKEVFKLKDYFDNLLEYNLYDLFPEIKDNL